MVEQIYDQLKDKLTSSEFLEQLKADKGCAMSQDQTVLRHEGITI